MTAQDIAFLLTAFSGLVGTIFAGIAAIYAAKAHNAVEKTSDQLLVVGNRMQAVVKATDGMKDELVKEVRQAAFAQGVKSEQVKNGG